MGTNTDTGHPPAQTTGIDAADPRLAVPVAPLRQYHRNARRGNVDAIAASLQANTAYKPITINRGTHTGRPREILAGNHTWLAAKQLGWTTIAAVWVDVDDEAAARIVAADNRTSDMADYDMPKLAELLADLGGDYIGSGYDVYDVERIAAEAAAAFDPNDVTPDAGPVPRLDRSRTIECPTCHAQFDATSAVEIRTPNVGGRA